MYLLSTIHFNSFAIEHYKTNILKGIKMINLGKEIQTEEKEAAKSASQGWVNEAADSEIEAGVPFCVNVILSRHQFLVIWHLLAFFFSYYYYCCFDYFFWFVSVWFILLANDDCLIDVSVCGNVILWGRIFRLLILRFRVG